MLIRKILSVVLSLAAATCLAAADINKASQAELESVKGIGPAMSGGGIGAPAPIGISAPGGGGGEGGGDMKSCVSAIYRRRCSRR